MEAFVVGGLAAEAGLFRDGRYKLSHVTDRVRESGARMYVGEASKEHEDRAISLHMLCFPQLALGFKTFSDIGAFASFAHHTGDGFDFDIDLFGPNDRKDYRKNYWLLGASIRF